jgi:5-methyltetrahydropteroyltriglutamate--homocysteine methyltransferase
LLNRPTAGLEFVRSGKDRRDFADYYAWAEGPNGLLYYRSPGDEGLAGLQPVCTAPIRYTGHEALQQDIQNLTAAARESGAIEAFMPATAPGSVGWENDYYETDEDYLYALAEALREEYRAIVNAGLILQVDDPYLPAQWDVMLPNLDIDRFFAYSMLRVEALNYALEGIPEDRVRVHICWGSWHGSHSTDVPLKTILPLLLKMNVGGYSFEAANARHEHEWEIWKDVDLPEGRVLVPGVVSHATDTIEHPDLVAARLRNFASVVGRENVIASTDCGFGYRVHPQIGWAKLHALAEGAGIASHQLWSS